MKKIGSHMRHYPKQQSGLVLLIALIFVQIFMGISLFSFYAIQINKKILHQSLQHLQKNYHALNILHTLSQTADIRKCRITLTNPVKLFEKPISWWQDYACFGQDGQNKYFYVMEFLGNDDCSYIYSENCSVNYYRLSMMWTGEYPKVVSRLQTTIATCGDQKPACDSPRAVFKGVQMQREINF